MRSLAVIVVLIALLGATASAQDLPDYPPFEFSGQIGGNPNQSTFTSNSSGILVASANVYGSFHYYKLRSLWDPARLRFRISCVYVNNDNQIVTSPTYEDGQLCPASGSSNSRYVRAMRISLEGSEKENYRLDYECWIGYFNQNTLTPFGRVDAGEMCGHESGGAPTEWISKIQIRLSRE